MITTKDLNSITEILARNKYKDHVDLLNDFQTYFKEVNPRFNIKRFADYYLKCSVPQDVKQIEKALNKNQLELF
tara:strand:- start:348 stop:569 length:222 start_codon:yes stop_codon:yes gene_type:complete